jgi:CDP-diacylglycerol---glycerol-3-phosphate 3-phosphatidyltransferase
LNVPNTLTLARVLLIPIFIVFLSNGDLFGLPLDTRSFIALVIFSIASITDWLDGYIARKTGQITKLGKLFDPIADKLLTSAALILLVDHNRASAWIVILIIWREFAVTGLRAAAAGEGHIIPAAEGGKAKLVFQTIAIIALLMDMSMKFEYLDTYLIGTVTLWVSMILAVVSGFMYFKNSWRKIGLMGGK